MEASRSVLLVLCVAASCQATDAEVAARYAQDVAKPASAANTANITQADIDTVRRRWEAALRTKDSDTVRQLIDWQRIQLRMRADIHASKAQADGFLTGLWRGLWKQGLGPAAEAETLVFVGQRTVDGVQAVQYRVAANGSVNYFDIIPGWNRNGELVIADFSSLSVGETGTAMANRVMLSFLATKQAKHFRLLWPRHSPGDRETLRQFQEALDAKQCESASAKRGSLSTEIRSATEFAYYDIILATTCADLAAYRRAIAALETRDNPFYPAHIYWTYQMHLEAGDPVAAAAQLERLMPYVANDPYLDELRAGLLAEGPNAAPAVTP